MLLPARRPRLMLVQPPRLQPEATIVWRLMALCRPVFLWPLKPRLIGRPGIQFISILRLMALRPLPIRRQSRLLPAPERYLSAGTVAADGADLALKKLPLLMRLMLMFLLL